MNDPFRYRGTGSQVPEECWSLAFGELEFPSFGPEKTMLKQINKLKILKYIHSRKMDVFIDILICA